MGSAAAAVTFVSFSMAVMMAAGCVRVVLQRSFQIASDDRIRFPARTRKELHARFFERHSGAHSDASADQSIHIRRPEESCQRAVARPGGIDEYL